LIEKELTLAVNGITMLKKENQSPKSISAGFEKQIAKLKLVKAKYIKLSEEEKSFFDSLNARVSHLANCQSEESVPIDIANYLNLRLERIILDYMLRQGYFQTAKLYAALNHINVSPFFLIFLGIFRSASLSRNKDDSSTDKIRV